MHLEIVVEDQSGKIMLENLLPKVIGEDTFRVTNYKGVGHIPPDINAPKNAKHRLLLHNLPKLIQGFGRTYDNYPPDYSAFLIVICDLDDKCLKIFREELLTILNSCNPKPQTRFCIAIEEGEAWLLGDYNAILKAYPKAKQRVIENYEQDSICGTWEILANALYDGGASKLLELGYPEIGKQKAKWAKKITSHMDIENNDSPSFCYFRDKLRELKNSPH